MVLIITLLHLDGARNCDTNEQLFVSLNLARQNYIVAENPLEYIMNRHPTSDLNNLPDSGVGIISKL